MHTWSVASQRRDLDEQRTSVTPSLLGPPLLAALPLTLTVAGARGAGAGTVGGTARATMGARRGKWEGGGE